MPLTWNNALCVGLSDGIQAGMEAESVGFVPKRQLMFPMAAMAAPKKEQRLHSNLLAEI